MNQTKNVLFVLLGLLLVKSIYADTRQEHYRNAARISKIADVIKVSKVYKNHPEINNIEKLAKWFMDEQYYIQEMPKKDVWGNDIVYVVDKKGKYYFLYSVAGETAGVRLRRMLTVRS